MLLESLNTYPSLTPDTLHSFSPYPLSSRAHLHKSLLHPSSASSSQAGPSTYRSSGIRGIQSPPTNADPDEQAQDARRSAGMMRRRAEERVLMGRTPAGVMLGREDDEVTLEEEMMDQEQHDVTMFGHRFLLPYGRRQTQMEMDSAPSPSPSEADHERRQEDPSGILHHHHHPPEDDTENEDDEDVADLDGSVEDMDASQFDDEEDEDEGLEAEEEGVDSDDEMEDMDEE
ncbi:hypothetical protein B9479_003120 [Cryptococcus floricola]|uniref:Uncharacterized protein n=1 Tax=Cryptococcus floricola TaxID=2591691 RepID=A0A5D3B077_9TREE|nr:hypothetical protein B9479_003120 [Cryptococcus floricola]